MTTPPVLPPDPLAQIRDLESRFAAAMTQLYAVGNGLAEVRHALVDARTDPAAVRASPGAASAPSTPAVASAPVHSAPAPPPVSTAPQVVGQPATPTAPRSPGQPTSATPAAPGPLQPQSPMTPAVRWWERPGAVSRVLGAVGAVVTLIGVAMLLAIAVAAGVFGPLPRVVSGAVLAAALLAGGAVARRRSPGTVGGEALAATGLATAYLTLLAATALYGFVPGWLGLVLAAALAVGAFALARAWDRQLLALLAAAPPALLAPAVTGIDSLATISFVALLLVGSAFAHIGRDWGWLYLARTGPAVIVLLAGVAAQHRDTFPTLTVAASVALGMIAAGAVERSRRLEQLPMLAALAGSLPLVGMTWMLEEHVLAVSGSFAALFLCLAALVAAVTPGLGLSRWLWVAPLVTGSVLLVTAGAQLPTETRTGIALAVAAAAYGLVAAWRRTWPAAVAGGAVAVVSALTFAGPVLATTSALELDVLAQPLVIVHGLALTALAPLAVAVSTAVRGGRRDPTMRWVAAAWAFVFASTTVIAAGAWLGSLGDETRVGFYGGHAVATALWTALGALLITVLARRARDRGVMVRLGLGLIAVAMAKLFLFDLSFLGGLFRVVAFVVSGVIVLIVGVAYSRMTEETNRPEP